MKKKKEEVWRDINGKKIKVSDMTEEYAKNVLRMILRKQRKQSQREWNSIP